MRSLISSRVNPLGEVVTFPRKKSEPEYDGVTEHELAHYLRLLNTGSTPDEAAEIVALARRKVALAP